MPDQKAEILSEFDALIADLRALIAKIPPVVHDRYSRRDAGGYISPENRDTFLEVRTRALKLLSRIDSKDTSLKYTVNYIRDVDVILFNIESMLHQLQGLRSDYDADILTIYPRLPETSVVAPVEKRRWLDEPKAIIVAAIISVLGVVLAAIVSFWLGQVNSINSVTNKAVILTYTPNHTATFEQTSEPTIEITLEP